MTALVSPSTGSAKTESTCVTRPSAPTSKAALKRPGWLNETVLVPSALRRTVALLRCAAFSAPCGVIQSWCIRSVTKRGPGAAVVPVWFQAISPFMNWSLRCCSRDRIAAAAERLGAAEDDLVAHRAGVEVDRARHRVHGDLGPDAARRVGLAEGEAGAVGRVAQGLEPGRPHRLGRARQRRGRVVTGRCASDENEGEASDEEASKRSSARQVSSRLQTCGRTVCPRRP